MAAHPTTVLVLGAAGFIGRHTAQELARQGCCVLGLGHGTWLECEWRQWGISRWLEADISLDSISRISAGTSPTCIVHCAGSGAVSYSYANPLKDFDGSVQSTVATLEWIRLNSAKNCRFVFVSSAAVYGDQGDCDTTENSLRSPISPYGVHKLAAEMMCESYNRFFGIEAQIVRLFSVYGEGLRKQLLWDAVNKFRVGQSLFLGTGNELRDWIHIDDAATLLALVCLTPQSLFEIYNGGGEQATTKEVLDKLASACGFDIEISFNNESHKGNPRRLTSNFKHTSRLLNWFPKIKLDIGLHRYAQWVKTLPNPTPPIPND